MIRAIYRDGVIQPLDTVPTLWRDGEPLTVEQAGELLGPDDPLPDLENRLAALHALGAMEFEPGEEQEIERALAAMDAISKVQMQHLGEPRS